MHQRLQERDRAEALAGQEPRSPRTTPRDGAEMTVRGLWRNVVANCAHIVSSHAGASASITVPDVSVRARRDLPISTIAPTAVARAIRRTSMERSSDRASRARRQGSAQSDILSTDDARPRPTRRRTIRLVERVVDHQRTAQLTADRAETTGSATGRRRGGPGWRPNGTAASAGGALRKQHRVDHVDDPVRRRDVGGGDARRGERVARYPRSASGRTGPPTPSGWSVGRR